MTESAGTRFELGQVVTTVVAGSPDMQIDELLEGGRVRVSWLVRGRVQTHVYPAAGLQAGSSSPGLTDEQIAEMAARLRAVEDKPKLAGPRGPLMLEGPADAIEASKSGKPASAKLLMRKGLDAGGG